MSTFDALVWHFGVVVLVVSGLGLAGSATAQPDEPAIAPLTHDRHLHHHNPKHERVIDAERFTTNREAASPLYLPAEEEAFTFAVFGDRTGGPHEGIDVLAHAVADANLLEPDLVMTVGDMIDGYNEKPGWLEQMSQFREVMNELRCPWFPVAGNHDVYWRGDGEPPVGEHEAAYEMHFGPLWYAFDHKNCRFIVLYSDEGDPATGKKSFRDPVSQRMSPEQLDWLKQTLADAKDAHHVFVFMHHPRWTGGQYADTWEPVHRVLKEAGNVRAVFAGHIHRMRYDPRDGIEYVTLATVGGVQRGTSPAAGFLHHFNLVTVRPDQIALASVPVGEVMDVRHITGEVSTQVSALAGTEPVFSHALSMGDDGYVSESVEITLQNPTTFAVDLALTPLSPDPRWAVFPDHLHGQIEPGASEAFVFQVERPAESRDDFLRPLFVDAHHELLTDAARFPLPTRRHRVPGTLELTPPSPRDGEGVLRPGDGGVRFRTPLVASVRSGANTEGASVTPSVPPVTVEAWVQLDEEAGRAGAIAGPGFRLGVSRGRPVFAVYAGGRWRQVPDGDEPAAALAIAPLKPGRANHLAGVYDGTRLRLFVNGEPVGETPASGPLRNMGQVIVGGEPRGDGVRRHWPGWVDEARVSTAVRYTERFSPRRRLAADDDTRLLLHFDTSRGGFVFDHGPGGRHGELVGEASVAEPDVSEQDEREGAIVETPVSLP